MSELPSSNKGPGLVYTFYSYKGGVGRSMALANVGVLMAVEGHRVLLVDWDLEAPGLEVFFRNAAKIVGDTSVIPGIVDLLNAQAQGTPLTWEDCLLRAEFFGHSLDILSSGRRTDDYRRRVQQLDWDTLYREHQIGNYIDALRQEWRNEYDFVLVDSRTGITDTGDICTVILPDVLVLLFITNYQNIEGIKTVMSRAMKARSRLPVNRNKLLGVPVPARDERYHDYDKSVEWQRIFAAEFSELYREWLPKEVNPVDALNHIFLPYVSGWSFGERIPVIESERERADPTSLGAAYARLAALLSHRLDWSAIEAKASPADVAGARVELSKAREAAREAEFRLAEETKRRKQEVRREEAKRRELESALQEAHVASAKTKTRARIVFWVGSFLLLFATATGIWWYVANPSAERLVARLRSADPEVRAEAVLALTVMAGRMDQNVSQFAPELVALFKDRDAKVRERAASALPWMAIRDPNVFRFAPELAALLKDTDKNVRMAAADALSMGTMGKPTAKFAPDVAALLKDGDPGVREAAAYALGRMGTPGAKFAPDIAALLKDGDPGVRRAAAAALTQMGEEGLLKQENPGTP